MELEEGLRVRLAADLRLAGSVTAAGGSAVEAGAAAGFLSLAAGCEGTVERVDEHVREQGPQAREYERLKSLLDSFGAQMPPASRRQAEEQVGALEPEWAAWQRDRRRVTARIRFDNGFVLDDAPEGLFTPAP
ncbi:hypothetical protein SUDANB120_00151 [Streptomyces sp. enrichment culture]|uniref:hypothetical protein n=1 Tax=Streptomyces TaxID=1883 RepID=UPI00167386D0|nr:MULTISPECIES: hypothetical protein [Streptomyces]MBD3579305.1 hypothetical protein [Streptomyces sp. KD18]GGT03072.1 hypothetical protein GCM10010286_30360 [Streptomyces toxytricini]